MAFMIHACTACMLCLMIQAEAMFMLEHHLAYTRVLMAPQAGSTFQKHNDLDLPAVFATVTCTGYVIPEKSEKQLLPLVLHSGAQESEHHNAVCGGFSLVPELDAVYRVVQSSQCTHDTLFVVRMHCVFALMPHWGQLQR